MEWEKLMDFIADNFGDRYINHKEGFFICPACESVVFLEDYEELEEELCPFCDIYWRSMEVE